MAGHCGMCAVLKHKPETQRFFYFPTIMRSEAIAIKVWDSAARAVGGKEKNIAAFSFHSAFDEEAPDERAPHRQVSSLERDAERLWRLD